MEDLTLSFEMYNAHLVRGVIEATAPPSETVADARMRSGAIIVMFKDFDPVTALESMIACQCIALRFMLMAATRDVSVATVDVKTQIRMRSSAVAISRALEGWMARFQATQRHNGIRAAEAARKEDASAPAAPGPAAPSTRNPEPSAAAIQPLAPAASFLGEAPSTRIGPGEQPRADVLFAGSPRPGPSLRDAMLTSTTLSHGVSGFGAGGTPPGG